MALLNRDKYKIVVSDFHLGGGPVLPDGRRNYLEDFFYDSQFCEFLAYHRSGPYRNAEVELIINGDFFNHMQVDPDEPEPTYVSQRVALARTGAIMEGHAAVFDALKEFAATPHHRVTFVIGNHDIGLFFPSVRELVRRRLGPDVTVVTTPRYIADGVCVEHGNRYTIDNWLDYEHPFVDGGRGEPVVSLPFGNLFAVHFLNKVKRERAYVTRVYPFKHYVLWGLFHDTLFAFRTLGAMAVYFIKALLGVGSFRKFRFHKTLTIVHEFSFPATLRRAAKHILDEHPECRAVLLGHGHAAVQQQFPDGREYLNTGVWNEMISLDIGTLGRSTRLTFAEISYEKGGTPRPRLKEWHGRYRDVDDVVSF